MVFSATTTIDEAGPERLACSRRVKAGYAKFSRRSDIGVRFGPNDPNVLLGRTVKIGGAGRNWTYLNNSDREEILRPPVISKTIRAN